MRVDNAINIGPAPVDDAVRVGVCGRAERPFHNPAFDVDNNHVGRREFLEQDA